MQLLSYLGSDTCDWWSVYSLIEPACDTLSAFCFHPLSSSLPDFFSRSLFYYCLTWLNVKCQDMQEKRMTAAFIACSKKICIQIVRIFAKRAYFVEYVLPIEIRWTIYPQFMPVVVNFHVRQLTQVVVQEAWVAMEGEGTDWTRVGTNKVITPRMIWLIEKIVRHLIKWIRERKQWNGDIFLFL